MNAMQTMTRSESAMPGATVIEGRHVGKTFGGGSVIALEGASFDVTKGSFVSLVGPSGCGKSTLLRLIAGLIDRTSGQLTVHGVPVTGPHTDVGMARAMELLAMVGLKDFAFSFPSQLSGGMQQRVALARLLQTGADILLLDEPFGALDEFTRERLNLELMRIVSEVGATTLFVTHNILEAIFLADEVMVMTPRPGRLARMVHVPFARPRTPELTLTPEFNALVAEVRDILGTQ